MTKIIGASGLDYMFTTYIIQSEASGMYYIGSTDNLEQRILKHNKRRSKFTKRKGPFKVVCKEEFTTRAEARKREYYLKSLKSKRSLVFKLRLKSRKYIEKLIRQALVV